MKQRNEKNLMIALNEILNRAEAGVPMRFTQLCNAFHLGSSTANRLKYALLEYEYHIPKSDKPLTKMYIARDGKVWKFRFKSSNGSKRWNFIEEDLEDIKWAMSQCPQEKATPWYQPRPRKKDPVPDDLFHVDPPIEEEPSVVEIVKEENVHKEQEASAGVLEEQKSKSLSEYSTEELAEELFKRGWLITYGAII